LQIIRDGLLKKVHRKNIKVLLKGLEESRSGKGLAIFEKWLSNLDYTPSCPFKCSTGYEKAALFFITSLTFVSLPLKVDGLD
jgi:hypothetical protein